MSDLQHKYEHARKEYNRTLKKVGVSGVVGMALEKAHYSAARRMIKLREDLIARGEWDGPIPIPPKDKP